MADKKGKQRPVIDELTDGSQKTQITQEVTADANNSSTTNLAAGATFTGVKTSTLGVVGLQWSLKTTENCTVYIDQSPDGTNWDLSYSFDYIASKGGAGETVQATQAYWRIRVKNEGASTTSSLRLQGVLCPIATPLPSSLSDDARLKTESHISDQLDRHARINPTEELSISPVYRMVGTAFDNGGVAGAVDTNFWTAVVTNSGTVVQTGGIVTASTTTTDSTTELTSVRRARFVAGSAMLFQGGFASSAAVANNTRRIGAYDDDDGVFAQLAGTTFSVGTRKATTDTLVNSGSFNGDMGDTFAPVADTYYRLSIEYAPLAVYFYVNSKLLHSITGGNYMDTMTLPARMENNNSGTDAATTFKSIGLYIARQGELYTNPTSKFISDVSTTILKVGAGTVKGIVISSVVDDTVVSFYDGLAVVAGDLLWTSGIIAAKTDYAPIPIDLFGMPFSDGLTLAITAENCDVLAIYE
jgi:hypothetical protein